MGGQRSIQGMYRARNSVQIARALVGRAEDNAFGPLLPFGVRRRILQSRPLMLSQRPPIGHVRFAASIGQSIGHLRDRLLGRDRSRRKAKTEPQAVDLAADLERFNLRFGGRHHGPQT